MRLEPPRPLPVLDGVFNELSLEQRFSGSHAAARGLRDLYHLIKGLKRLTWDQAEGQDSSQNTRLYNLNRLFRQELTADGVTCSSLLRSMRNTQEKEFIDAFRNLLSKSLECPPSEEGASLNGDPALGLTCARDMAGLALSLLTDSRWDSSEVTLDDGAVVTHLSHERHLSATGDWFRHRLGDFAAFLREVHPDRLDHKLASEYKKHVRGSNNDERQRCAQGGDGQYLCREGTQVFDDPFIKTLETRAIIALRQGSPEARLELHGGSTFYILYTHPTPVGFAGKTGALTRKIRVEWSSGTVHSHPREW